MKYRLTVKRVAAYLVDIILLFATLAPIVTLVEWLSGVSPQTPRQVWIASVLSFSIPTWLYFILSDHSKMGATIGKRLFHLRVKTKNGSRLSFMRAFVRTAIKLLPWEMAHIFGFALAEDIPSVLQSAGLISANLLTLLYLVITIVLRESAACMIFW